MAALAANSAGTELYAGQYVIDTVLGLQPTSPANGYLTQFASYSPTPAHDVAVGPAGHVFATNIATQDTGVQEFDQTLLYITQDLPGIAPNHGTECQTFSDGNQHCWHQLSGMVWDNATPPHLWVSSDTSGDNGIFEFAVPPPGFNCGAPLCPLNFTPDLYGNNGDSKPIGLAVAPANDPSNPNYIIVANFDSGNVIKINPVCNGTLNAPGICTQTEFITANDFGGSPKYPVYYNSCPNPGYLEICKAASTQNPPPNQLYDFTVTAPLFSSETIQVPLGDCSGPIQVPSATLPNVDTITESPVIGVLVSDVTAIAYNPLGQQFNQLGTWMLPDLNAGVGVQPGDVSLGTIATFTNYAVQSDGQLKVCKIAGPGTPVMAGPFTFTATGVPSFKLYAGPADQGGYCELVNTYQVNTSVTVTEVYRPTVPYKVGEISVECNGCTYTTQIPSVTTTIGAGITEVDFTNIPNMAGNVCPAGQQVYNDGPVDGNTDAWTINYGFVVSDSFNVTSNATLTGLCFYAWLAPGDTMNSVEASITPLENGGTPYFDKQVSTSCMLYCSAGPSCGTGSYDVYECVSPLGINLPSGPYWLNLQNAVVPSGNAAYWDENSGPSMASDNELGTIPAESFIIYGDSH